MHVKLADELIAAYNREGAAMSHARTSTAWPTPTRRSPTSPGNQSNDTFAASTLHARRGFFVRHDRQGDFRVRAFDHARSAAVRSNS